MGAVVSSAACPVWTAPTPCLRPGWAAKHPRRPGPAVGGGVLVVQLGQQFLWAIKAVVGNPGGTWRAHFHQVGQRFTQL